MMGRPGHAVKKGGDAAVNIGRSHEGASLQDGYTASCDGVRPFDEKRSGKGMVRLDPRRIVFVQGAAMGLYGVLCLGLGMRR